MVLICDVGQHVLSDAHIACRTGVILHISAAVRGHVV